MEASFGKGSALNQVTLHEAGEPLPSAAGAKAPRQRDARTEAVKAIVMKCLDEMKAIDIVEIDLVGKTTIADCMVIASGGSQRQVGAIADRIVEILKADGFGPVHVEGMPACDWVLIDASDVLVHLFRPEVRAFYNLEKMWGADRPQEQPRSEKAT